MKVWLLWEHGDYEGSELHGVFSTEAKAVAGRERMRQKFRRENRKMVGDDDVFDTVADANGAADRRIADFIISSESVR